MLIYKIFKADEWADLNAQGQTRGAMIDLADGFIHFSAADQVAETAAKHFAGIEGLVLCAVPAAPLGEDLKWEISRGGARFPHLFRALNLSEVSWSAPLPLGPNGHEFPELPK